MRLIHYELENALEWSAPSAKVLVVENPRQCQCFVMGFYRQCRGDDGSWVAEEANKPLVLSKVALFWSEYFAMTETEKKLHTKLLERLAQNALRDEMYVRTHTILSEWEQYVGELVDSIDCDLTVRVPELLSLLKTLGVDWSESSDLLLVLSDYITALSTLTNVRLLICLHLYDYLSLEELAQLWRHVALHDMYLLDIETHEVPPVDEEKILIVDSDLCEFYIQGDKKDV